MSLAGTHPNNSQRKMFLPQNFGTFLDISSQHLPDDVPLVQSMDKEYIGDFVFSSLGVPVDGVVGIHSAEINQKKFKRNKQHHIPLCVRNPRCLLAACSVLLAYNSFLVYGK